MQCLKKGFPNRRYRSYHTTSRCISPRPIPLQIQNIPVQPVELYVSPCLRSALQPQKNKADKLHRPYLDSLTRLAVQSIDPEIKQSTYSLLHAQ